eukprot:CAMPEP_0177442002 /NCGR_PEP_ID=MMETSP0369-20130122/4704_2 /TAXON_ID=447022 ORGANISM="Scrippsiella hangoei-like, Strain SHHI-4" /NCGR_SAMPLE_ID=MMETSP0369 /ASSEMBLY_ACC=CAM_ASM_000364 /LENGTH=299 /DNA_ID=CAMNT_0018913903 /DNA_START=53 /DNA_END=952 /DNA_ORIENTATION=-
MIAAHEADPALAVPQDGGLLQPRKELLGDQAMVDAHAFPVILRDGLMNRRVASPSVIRAAGWWRLRSWVQPAVRIDQSAGIQNAQIPLALSRREPGLPTHILNFPLVALLEKPLRVAHVCGLRGAIDVADPDQRSLPALHLGGQRRVPSRPTGERGLVVAVVWCIGRQEVKALEGRANDSPLWMPSFVGGILMQRRSALLRERRQSVADARRLQRLADEHRGARILPIRQRPVYGVVAADRCKERALHQLPIAPLLWRVALRLTPAATLPIATLAATRPSGSHADLLQAENVRTLLLQE